MTRSRLAAGPWIALAVLAIAGCTGETTSTGPKDAVSHDPGLIRPAAIHLGGSSVEQATPIVLKAQELYTFWATAQRSWLDRAEDGSFQDRTLPAGRPQGPEGQVLAAQHIRAAVPDVKLDLNDVYVTGDTFTARLTFTGHFTGSQGGVKGDGRPIRFEAIDIQHLGPSGKIVEDWHIEDNLTFMQQAGLVPGSTSQPAP